MSEPASPTESQPHPPAKGPAARQSAAAAVEAHRVGLETVQQAAAALTARQERWEAIRRAATTVQQQARSVEAIGRAARALQSRLQRVEKLRRVATPGDSLAARLERIDQLELDALTEAITATLAADALQAAEPEAVDPRELLAAAGIEPGGGDGDEAPDLEQLADPGALNRLIEAVGRAEQPTRRLALLQLAIELVRLFIDRQIEPGGGGGGQRSKLRETEAVRTVRKHVQRRFAGHASLGSGRVVAREGLKLHRQPTPTAPVIRKLPLGAIVGLTDKRKHWAHVRCGAADRADGSGSGEPVEGWVRSKYLKPLSR